MTTEKLIKALVNAKMIGIKRQLELLNIQQADPLLISQWTGQEIALMSLLKDLE